MRRCASDASATESSRMRINESEKNGRTQGMRVEAITDVRAGTIRIECASILVQLIIIIKLIVFR